MEAFFDTGSLRLGTVHSFKDVVEYGLSRGDDEEGRHHISRHNDGVITLRKGIHHPVVSEIFKFEGEGESWIHGGTFIVPRVSPDAFIFCTSREYTEDLFISWNEEEGLDSCYAIMNPIAFAQSITREIQSSAFFVASANVVYTDKEIDFKSPEARMNPAITKRKDLYQWQNEHRMIWAPKLPSPPLEPWVIQVPHARQYCHKVARYKKGRSSYDV